MSKIQSLKTTIEISPKMQHMYDAIKNHLTMNTSGALLITGDWGSGKTFYLKNTLFPKIEAELKTIPIIVSLYGVTDKAGIASKVFFAYLDKIGKDKFISSATVTKGVRNLFDSIPFLKQYVDINKLFASSAEDLFRFLPKDKLLICFDDLERISNKINPEDFLGMVNELVENKGSHVVIIANEGVIDGGIKFKEKTIEKTVHFTNDMSDIFDSLLVAYEGIDYYKYLLKNKEFILNSISYYNTDQTNTQELKVAFANIRTIKFAIEHFRLAFEIINKALNINEPLVQQKLKGCWLFTLAISVEFKKSNSITLNERRNLDHSIMPFNSDDIANLLYDNSEENVIENEWTYRNSFIDKYFKRISEPYVYMPEIYTLITAGQTINKKAFLSDLQTSYQIKENTINPAQEFLKKFLHGYWNFSDADFIPALNQLLDYAEQGKYDDIVSYLNTGVYLIGFSDIMHISKQEIEEKLQKGLDIYIKSIGNNILVQTQLDMVSGQFEEEHLQRLIIFIKKQFKNKEKEEISNEASRMKELFVKDTLSFTKELIPANPNVRSPDKLLFNMFDETVIDRALETWQPSDIMNITSYFKIRYLDPSFADRLTSEIQFLEALKIKLDNYNYSDKLLSTHLIKTQAIPRITACIDKLNSFNKTEIS